MTQFVLSDDISMLQAFVCRDSERLTSQEAVQLHQQLEVDIVALWRLSVRAANVMSVEIDTYSENLIVSL